MSSEASYLAPHGPKPQENFLIKTTAPSCKGISFPGPKGNYPESGRGDFFFFPGPQKPRNQVRWGRMLRMSKTEWVVMACYTGWEDGLWGLGSETWYFGLGGGQPRRGCGSGCCAELTWRA